MKLDPPYPVLNIDGQIARHVATLIEVRPAIDRKTGGERIKTISHPVVDYGDNYYSGIVYEDKELADCEVLRSPLSMMEFHMMVRDSQSMFNPRTISRKPEQIVNRLNKFGISVKFPCKQDADGFDTDEPADVVKVEIWLEQNKDGSWGAESRGTDFCFDCTKKNSKEELLRYIRDMRSSYYQAFKDKKFDIVFYNSVPASKPLLDELNANPHL